MTTTLPEVPTVGAGGIVPREYVVYGPQRFREPTIHDLIGPCLDALDVSEKTKGIYARNIGYFADWLQREGRTGSDRADFIAYKGHLTESYEASTVSAYMTPVRVLYQWASSEGMTRDITIGIKGPKKARGFRKDPLSVDQAKALMSVGEGDPDALRDRALTSLLIHTGIRTIEASRADIGDICTLAGFNVLRIWGKGRAEKDEFVILTSDVLQALDAYIASREDVTPDAPLFASRSNHNRGGRLTTRSISRIVKARMEEAGISSDRITAHSLRHTAVTLALMGGATIQEAQAMARHANINTTLIYAHNLERMNTPAEGKIAAILGS